MTTLLSKKPVISNPKISFAKAVSKKGALSLILATSAFIITGCQTTQHMGTTPNANSSVITGSAPQYPELLQSFNIRGKIGITTPKTENSAAQTGSAFYVWAQEQDRFAIDLTGALGIGHTVIEYDGRTATLVSDRTGEIKAASPETAGRDVPSMSPDVRREPAGSGILWHGEPHREDEELYGCGGDRSYL